jgi:hypothetical protein
MFCYTSCILPPEDLPIPLHHSMHSFLHVIHLEALYNTKAIAVPSAELEEMKEAPQDKFGCMESISLANGKGWNCIYSVIVQMEDPGKIDDSSCEFQDPWITLLSGCRVKHTQFQWIHYQGTLHMFFYSPPCKTWDEFQEKSLEYQEVLIPEEDFAAEIQLNLMGFCLPVDSLPYLVTFNFLSGQYYFKLIHFLGANWMSG